MSKRLSPHKKCDPPNGISVIVINHTKGEDYQRNQQLLGDYTIDDQRTNIKFIVENVEIPAHKPVLEILKYNRQLVRDAIEKERNNAINDNSEEATIFKISGTTVDGFKKLLEYIYTGKVECDIPTGINLAKTADKLKFNQLVASLAEHLPT